MLDRPDTVGRLVALALESCPPGQSIRRTAIDVLHQHFEELTADDQKALGAAGRDVALLEGVPGDLQAVYEQDEASAYLMIAFARLAEEALSDSPFGRPRPRTH